MERYADRFEAPGVDGNPDLIFIDGSPSDAQAVPSFVFRRLTAIGVAYKLHYLGSVLYYDEENHFDPTQVAGLIDELEFVGELVQDPLLRAALPDVIDTLTRYVRSRPTSALVIHLES
jgi:hypothetical protein